MPRTLLKNGKRSANLFLASRSKHTSEGCTPLAVNSPNNASQSPSGTPSPDRHNPVSVYRPEQNRSITSLTRELGSLRRDTTQFKSEVKSLRNTSNSDTCLIYVRLKYVVSNDFCESLFLNCVTICHSIIRNESMISLRVRIRTCYLHSALTSTNTHLACGGLATPLQLPAQSKSAMVLLHQILQLQLQPSPTPLLLLI